MIGQKMLWIDEIVEAMTALGGAARYSDLYELIAATTKRTLTSEWKATVRRTIEDHSSNSANFRSTDLFEHVSHGHWKLRGVEIDEAELVARENLSPEQVIARVFVKEHWRDAPRQGEPRQDEEPTFAWCDSMYLRVHLRDGREIATPLWWYPSLLAASHTQRNTLELMFTGIHWPGLNEDLSIDGMLRGWKSPAATPPAVAAE